MIFDENIASIKLTKDDIFNRPDYSFAYFIWQIDSLIKSEDLSENEKLLYISSKIEFIKNLVGIK